MLAKMFWVGAKILWLHFSCYFPLQVCNSTLTDLSLPIAVCFSESCSPELCRCSDQYFQCLSGGCIPISKVCNFYNDCKDGSDEMVNTLYKSKDCKHVYLCKLFFYLACSLWLAWDFHKFSSSGNFCATFASTCKQNMANILANILDVPVSNLGLLFLKIPVKNVRIMGEQIRMSWYLYGRSQWLWTFLFCQIIASVRFKNKWG